MLIASIIVVSFAAFATAVVGIRQKWAGWKILTASAVGLAGLATVMIIVFNGNSNYAATQAKQGTQITDIQQETDAIKAQFHDFDPSICQKPPTAWAPAGDMYKVLCPLLSEEQANASTLSQILTIVQGLKTNSANGPTSDQLISNEVNLARAANDWTILSALGDAYAHGHQDVATAIATAYQQDATVKVDGKNQRVAEDLSEVYNGWVNNGRQGSDLDIATAMGAAFTANHQDVVTDFAVLWNLGDIKSAGVLAKDVNTQNPNWTQATSDGAALVSAAS